MERVILHSDLNNFYASVECRDNPELKGKPVAVCGDSELRHGIVLAKNYIAKADGVATGEPIVFALKKCATLVVITANLKKYSRAADEVRKIYADYTDFIEPFGLDECWLDVTHSIKMFGSKEKIAEEIRTRVKKETGLTVSIGVSYNKVFAKLGSDMRKPDAITYITADNYKEKVWKLPVADLLYVGRATQRKMFRYNVKTIGELANLPLEFLYQRMGKWGIMLHRFANGQDRSPVSKLGESSVVKSVGNGNTAPKDLCDFTEVKSLIYSLSESVATRLRKNNLLAQGVHIAIKDNTLELVGTQRKLNAPVNNATTIGKIAAELFKEIYSFEKPVRAITVTAYDLSGELPYQFNFFDDFNRQIKFARCENAVDSVRKKYNYGVIKRCALMIDKEIAEMNPVEDNVVHPIGFVKGKIL